MPGGRPTKLTPAIIEKVRTFLPVCMYIETLTDSLEIERKTYYNWYSRGEVEAKRMEEAGEDEPHEREALYLQFFSAVKKGLADGEMAAAARINVASQNTWQAAAWLLERRFPEKWGSRHRLEHTGKNGGPVEQKVEHVGLPQTPIRTSIPCATSSVPTPPMATRTRTTRRPMCCGWTMARKSRPLSANTSRPHSRSTSTKWAHGTTRLM